MKRLAESILDLLHHHQVDTVFGIPGNHNIELYRHLNNSGIRHVTARHEQGVGFMADGYARVSGRPGVCLLISGPGLTNAMTAMAQALADSVPMLVIATVGDQTSREGRLHELPDQLALARGVTVDAVQAKNATAALQWLDTALVAHKFGRPGPRYIQIPLSWWQLELPEQAPLTRRLEVPEFNDVKALNEAAVLLAQCSRPLVLIGGGAQAAATPVLALATQLGAPVVNTVNAKGVMPAGHILTVGGSPSLPGVRQLMSQADAIIAVGTELGETDYDLLMTEPVRWSVPMVRIDIDAQQAQLNVAPEVTLLGDATTTLAALVDALERASGPVTRACWTDVSAIRRVNSEHEHMHAQFAQFFQVIDETCPGAVVVGDSTRPTYYASWLWERPAPRRYFHCVSGYGTLGYALPAALGAQIAAPETPVVAIIGDGGVMFTLSELAVAVHEQLPVKIIVWDNSGYQEIAHSMAARDIAVTTTQYSSPDFVAIAAGFGVHTSAPCGFDELTVALAQGHAGPHLIHIKESDFITEPSGEWY